MNALSYLRRSSQNLRTSANFRQNSMKFIAPKLHAFLCARRPNALLDLKERLKRHKFLIPSDSGATDVVDIYLTTFETEKELLGFDPATFNYGADSAPGAVAALPHAATVRCSARQHCA